MSKCPLFYLPFSSDSGSSVQLPIFQEERSGALLPSHLRGTLCYGWWPDGLARTSFFCTSALLVLFLVNAHGRMGRVCI